MRDALAAIRRRDRRRYETTPYPNSQAGVDVHTLLAHIDSGTTLHLDDPADSIKLVQETLSLAQCAVLNFYPDTDQRRSAVGRLQRLIDECERQRPVGPDGKHGDLHTPTCGCADR